MAQGACTIPYYSVRADSISSSIIAGTVLYQTVTGFQSGPLCQPIDITYPLTPSSGERLAFPNPPNTPCAPFNLDSPSIKFSPHFRDVFEASLSPPPMVTVFVLHLLTEASKVLTNTLVSAQCGNFSDIETGALRMHLINAHIVLHYVWDVTVHADYVQDIALGADIDNGSSEGDM
ncbi:hypothetical protein EDD18DRAFT_1182042 [Armillaria luteobubalina]|uniref:Uncharacterized protein n=1 Tax=Armillaria luteobubalina TaxID=153913 RepID=A0AA39UQ80_9AGAR|nr:hypothetical protein EDD18DRAFT_1182042 [Armillaria luteobubalina]